MPTISEIRPDAVAIYIRWSTDEQTEGTTLANQQERCSLYVRSQGWEVNPDLVFIDDGYSGGSLDRPALAKLRELIAGRKIDCVVSYSLDRLSRSVADTVQLVQHEWLGRCIYRSASQPISTEDGNPTGQLIFNILASFAEFERALIRERTHSGLVRRAQQGIYPGSRLPPFGYLRDAKGHLVIHAVAPDGTFQGPAAVVHRIFELATSGPLGLGPTLIARTLASEGVPAPQGDTWWAQQVRLILKNPVYCGDLVYGRRRVNPAHKRDHTATQRLSDTKPLAVVRNATPAIVSRDLWERAQKRFADRSQRTARKNLQSKTQSLLASIAQCRCGGPLSIFYDRHKRRYYRCSRNFLSAGGCGCQPGVLPADEIEAAVTRAVKEKYGSPALRAAAAAEAAAVRASGNRSGRITAALSHVERRLQSVEADLNRLRRAARRGEVTFSTFEELRADAEAERTQLLSQKSDLESARERTQAAQSSVSEWVANVERVDLWDDLDLTHQRQILYGLLRSVTIFKPKGRSTIPVIDLEWEMPGCAGLATP